MLNKYVKTGFLSSVRDRVLTLHVQTDKQSPGEGLSRFDSNGTKVELSSTYVHFLLSHYILSVCFV